MARWIEKTVGEIAAHFTGAPRVLEMAHINYSTGGNHPFREACRVAGVSAEEVLKQIHHNHDAPPLGEENWNTRSTEHLIEHLVETHHGWSRESVPLIEALLDRIEGSATLSAHLPPVSRLRRLFTRMRHELEQHCRKEENVLFPAILKIESCMASSTPIPRHSFGSVRNPIALMESDHDADARMWDEIRDLTYGFSAPDDAPESVRSLFRELEKLDAAIHEHTHLENNILFKRVMDLERQRQQ